MQCTWWSVWTCPAFPSLSPTWSSSKAWCQSRVSSASLASASTTPTPSGWYSPSPSTCWRKPVRGCWSSAMSTWSARHPRGWSTCWWRTTRCTPPTGRSTACSWTTLMPTPGTPHGSWRSPWLKHDRRRGRRAFHPGRANTLNTNTYVLFMVSKYRPEWRYYYLFQPCQEGLYDSEHVVVHSGAPSSPFQAYDCPVPDE